MLVGLFLQKIQKLMSLLKETLIYLGNHWVVGKASSNGELQAVYDVFYLIVQSLIFTEFFTRWRERFRHKKGVAHNLELYRNQLDKLKEGEVR